MRNTIFNFLLNFEKIYHIGRHFNLTNYLHLWWFKRRKAQCKNINLLWLILTKKLLLHFLIPSNFLTRTVLRDINKLKKLRKVNFTIICIQMKTFSLIIPCQVQIYEENIRRKYTKKIYLYDAFKQPISDLINYPVHVEKLLED